MRLSIIGRFPYPSRYILRREVDARSPVEEDFKCKKPSCTPMRDWARFSTFLLCPVEKKLYPDPQAGTIQRKMCAQKTQMACNTVLPLPGGDQLRMPNGGKCIMDAGCQSRYSVCARSSSVWLVP